MKNIIKILLTTFIATILFFICSTNINAASSRISVSGPSSVTVGQTFTVTITASSSSGIGLYSYTLNYNSSKLSLVSGGTSVYQELDGQTSSSKSFKFKARSSGSSFITVKSGLVTTWEPVQETSPSISGKTVTASTPSYGGGSSSSSSSSTKTPDKNLSTNNYLKSLSINEGKLSPSFDKKTTSYTVSLEEGTKNISVFASAEDENASVSGTGKINVSEGANKINITVTAENGSTKTYTITANVKEKDPIKVQIDGKNLTVVKDADELKAPSGYKKTTIKIDGQEIPAFTNDTTKLTLVGLKDEKGNIALYVYDKDKNEYTKYIELSSEAIILYVMTPDEDALKLIKGYKKATIEFNNEKITAYKKKKSSDYSLIYGMNLATGKVNWYMYEETEGTLQLYDPDNENVIINEKEDNDKKKDYIILGLGGLLILILLINLINTLRKPKNKNNDFELEEKINNDKKINEDENKIQPEEEKEETKPKKKRKKKSVDELLDEM